MTYSGDCIPWAGVLRNGYGVARVGGKAKLAHRAIYEAARGRIPDGLVIDHLCRNRACVNPFHLEPVTRRENTVRGVRANGQKTHCFHGHPYDEANTYFGTNGQRACRTCQRAATNSYHARNREARNARRRKT